MRSGARLTRSGARLRRMGLWGWFPLSHFLVLLLSVLKLWGELEGQSQVADESSDWAEAVEFWVEKLLEEFPNVV